MAVEARPRSLAHRGHVLAHGVLHPARWSQDRARREVLATFHRGVRVYQVRSGLVSVWPVPRRLGVPLASGAPLVRYRSLLSSVPLTERELGQCQADHPALIDAAAGSLACSVIAPELEVDPSEWLSVDDFTVVKIAALTEPPRPPTAAISPAAASSRDALDSAVGAAPPALARVTEALARGADTGERASALSALAGFGANLARLLARTLDAFRRAPEPVAEDALARPSQASSGRSWFRAFSEWFKRWLWKGQLGRWLGQKHARYLTQLLRMFERGDYDEALRHAIPTSKHGSGNATLSLLPPSARASLELGARRGSGGGLGVGPELFGHLREVYRRAFRELERRGEFLKAAFVLSELLQEDAEAVSFLERNGMLVQAAKLAEARELAPGLVVRQWFVAGDRDRAVMIARRDGAFRDAVDRLGQNRELAEALCLLWAHHLAQSGDFAGAVLVAAQLSDAGALPLAWLRRAVLVGGVAGARALALWARRRPESFAEAAPVAHELLADRSAALSHARLALGTALADGPGLDTPERRALLRGVTRAVIDDRARGFNRLDRTSLERWSRASEDGALHTDLPGLPPLAELLRLEHAELRQVVVSAGDVGVNAWHDALLLDDGRWLLAKGEAGVVLLGRDLRQLHHFDVPASALVASRHGDRALALARRDSITRIARIDVPGRRCRPWAELEIGAYARSFDGASWYAAIGSHVHALDVIADEPRTLWRSADVGASVSAIEVSSTELCFATDGGECWVHDLAPHRLRRRSSCRGSAVLTPGGPVAGLTLETFALGKQGVVYFELAVAGEDSPESTKLSFEGSDISVVHQVAAARSWLLVGFLQPRGAELRLLTREKWRHVLSVVLEGTLAFRARLDDERLLVCDDRGRLLALDLTTGAAIVDARL